jgi:hypothetical protein
MTELKPCPFCGRSHPIYKFAPVIGYESESGEPIYGEWMDLVSLQTHGDALTPETWNTRPLEQSAYRSGLQWAMEIVLQTYAISASQSNYKDNVLANLKSELAKEPADEKREAAPELYEALEELDGIMEDIIAGEYTPDSFTLQPARAALAKADGKGESDV